MTEITARLTTALADRYRIERHLGEGGMATVYLAEDLKHERKVAVKVLHPELVASRVGYSIRRSRMVPDTSVGGDMPSADTTLVVFSVNVFPSIA